VLLDEVSESILQTCQATLVELEEELTVFKSWTSEVIPRLAAARSPQAARVKWRIFWGFIRSCPVSSNINGCWASLLFSNSPEIVLPSCAFQVKEMCPQGLGFSNY
jgi:hypothetical protein